MRASSTRLASVTRLEPTAQPMQDATPIDARRPAAENRFERPLRCVSSGYLSDGCSCQATVPASVVSDAWARELKYGDVREDQFFRFMWRGGAWLGYGLRDGGVRGVYCPEHSARRAQRSFVQDVSVAS